jgi:hypothetical protein
LIWAVNCETVRVCCAFCVVGVGMMPSENNAIGQRSKGVRSGAENVKSAYCQQNLLVTGCAQK